MNRIVIRSRDRASPFSLERLKEFEYDQEQFSYSNEAQDYIELLLMMNHSFTVDFVTEGTLRAARAASELLYRVAGYAPLNKPFEIVVKE